MSAQKVSVLRPAEVGAVLRDLIGKPVQVKELKPVLTVEDFYVVAEYEREDGALGASASIDLPLAASLAAALTLVPAGVADASIKAKKLEEMLEENLAEVLNVGGRVFNAPESPRVILKRKGTPPCAPPLKQFWVKAPTRYTLEVAVPGYKSGRIALCAA
jgi:hypothetical protein